MSAQTWGQLLRWKILLRHGFQSGPDQGAIRPKQTRGNPRELNRVSSLTTLDHPCVFSRVILRSHVGNAVAVKKRLIIKSKKRLAELLIEWVVQISLSPRALASSRRRQ